MKFFATLKPLLLALISCMAQIAWSAEAQSAPRRTISLDGQWQILETEDEGWVPSMPSFTRTVPVPGLVNLSEPEFPNLKARAQYVEKSFVDVIKPEWSHIPIELLNKKEPLYYYYRKTFKVDGTLPAVARLKLHKVRFGCSVTLNGQYLGERTNTATPLYFDVRDALKGDGAENELLIRVGNYFPMSNHRPFGGDAEIRFHYPGIYDSVELLLSGAPYIESVQVAPSLERGQIEVQTLLVNTTDKVQPVALTFIVRETNSGKEVARGSSSYDSRRQKALPGRKRMETVQISVPDARAWSPEDPFLYTLEVRAQTFPLDRISPSPTQDAPKPPTADLIDTDTFSARFGMREFTRGADGIPLLNGKKRFLRGTNLCIHRLFEDPVRGTLPWDKSWARKVIRSFKAMNWDSARFCLGFPPEIWYEAADEEGLLIQDEFSIWHGRKWPEELTVDNLIPQFRDWMRERWNHPSVVIWDAQNETFSAGIIPQVVARVRGEDMSNRSWNFGYDGPQRAIDFGEIHIYYFNSKNGLDIEKRNLQTLGDHMMEELRQHPERLSILPQVSPNMINEYGWLWLTRDGDPTILTVNGYNAFLGKHSTAEQRRELYARIIAMETESFRITRAGSGVQHLAGLASSRPTSYTSDSQIELKGPTFEPHFYKYVRDSFAPMGLMIDLWAPTFKAGESFEVPVYLVNDLGEDWSGDIEVTLLQGDRQIETRSARASVPTLLRGKVTIAMTVPKKGTYEIVAQLTSAGQPVRSYRMIAVK